jgi:MoaA/NifB/PqqE/SkfB family radical SAM enzyme
MTPYGEVTPCPFVPFAYGDLRDNTLEELWERFTARLDLKSPGFCPMNRERTREEFKRYIETVAGSRLAGAQGRAFVGNSP